MKGFSLIELMIVVAIIGILGGIAIPSYQTYLEKSRTAEVISAIAAKQRIVEEHVQSTGDYVCSGLTDEQRTVPPTNVIFNGSITNACVILVEASLAGQTGQGCASVNNQVHIIFRPHSDTNGNMTWVCTYLSGDSNPVNTLPSYCTYA